MKCQNLPHDRKKYSCLGFINRLHQVPKGVIRRIRSLLISCELVCGQGTFLPYLRWVNLWGDSRRTQWGRKVNRKSQFWENPPAAFPQGSDPAAIPKSLCHKGIWGKIQKMSVQVEFSPPLSSFVLLPERLWVHKFCWEPKVPCQGSIPRAALCPGSSTRWAHLGQGTADPPKSFRSTAPAPALMGAGWWTNISSFPRPICLNSLFWVSWACAPGHLSVNRWFHLSVNR